MIEEQTYNVDSANYFCATPVTAYNKVVITINNMTKANRFLKIFNISDGITREFYNDEIENLEIIEDISTNDEEIKINEASVRLIPKNNVGIMFQRTLPFKIYRDDTLYGYYFINSSESNTYKTSYLVKTDDYINVLQGQTYLGGIYTSITASSLFADILGDIPYELDATIGARTLSGYLPICEKREALKQVAFSVGAIIDTSRSDKIVIKQLPTTISATLGADKIVSINTSQENITTSVQLNLTTYAQKRRTSLEEIFSDKFTGTRYITFDAPKFDLELEDNVGTIVDYGDNWAIIQGAGNNTQVTLLGKDYAVSTQTFTKQNPYVVSTDIEKVVQYDTSLVWDTAQILDDISFVEFQVASVFEMGTIQVGDLISLNGMTCRVLELTYDISQPTIYAQAKLEAYYG